jgi:hypothetical protein
MNLPHNEDTGNRGAEKERHNYFAEYVLETRTLSQASQ